MVWGIVKHVRGASLWVCLLLCGDVGVVEAVIPWVSGRWTCSCSTAFFNGIPLHIYSLLHPSILSSLHLSLSSPSPLCLFEVHGLSLLCWLSNCNQSTSPGWFGWEHNFLTIEIRFLTPCCLPRPLSSVHLSVSLLCHCLCIQTLI